MKSIRRACSSRVRAMRDEDEAAGFTLVELLIVVAIIAILAAIAIPIYLVNLNNARTSAIKSQLQTSQTKIGAALAEGSSITDALAKGDYTPDSSDSNGITVSCAADSGSTDDSPLYTCTGKASGISWTINQDGTLKKANS